MSQENVDAARSLFKAVEERDLAGVLAAYDPEVVIREAASLVYGGVYHGLEDALRHASGYAQAWAAVQAPADLATDPLFLDAGEYAVVLWRQRGSASDGRKLDLPGGKYLQNARRQDRRITNVPRRHEGDSGILRRREINNHAREMFGTDGELWIR